MTDSTSTTQHRAATRGSHRGAGYGVGHGAVVGVIVLASAITWTMLQASHAAQPVQAGAVARLAAQACAVERADLTRTSTVKRATTRARIVTTRVRRDGKLRSRVKLTQAYKVTSTYRVAPSCPYVSAFTVTSSTRAEAIRARTRTTAKAARRAARIAVRRTVVKSTRTILASRATRTAQRSLDATDPGATYNGEFASAAWITAFRAELHRLTNEARARAGLGALVYATKLEPLADDWSRTVAANKTLSHDTGATGTSYDVLAACGAPVSSGENMGGASLGSLQLRGEEIHVDARDTPTEAAREAIDGWVNSPGHYSAMTAAGHTGQGFGVAITLDREELDDDLEWVEGVVWLTARFLKGPC